MRIRPIRSEADYTRALREIDRLWGSRGGTTTGDRLEILMTLAEAYEREHYPIDPPNPIDAIRFRLEQQGLDQGALVGIIGSRARVSEVMRGKRGLSLSMIRRLHEHLRIPVESLIRPISASRRAA
jgi:HTH-type transcriptional regulator / antitoxin HigA